MVRRSLALSAAVFVGVLAPLQAVSAQTAAPAIGHAHAAGTVNVVLVHGAWADGSGWRAVSALLERDGYHVTIVQPPLTGLDADVAATRRILARQDGPVVLVGHSYGGAVITAAGDDPKVKALVYVAAFQPDAGENVGRLVGMTPGQSHAIRPTGDGFLVLDPASYAADFAADVPAADADFMARSQTPIAAAGLGATLAAAAWHDKPSYGIVATEDRMVSPDLERWMYARSRADVTEIRASHAVYVSQPRAVADVIEKAARAAK